MLPRKFEEHRERSTRERAELCEGLPGKLEILKNCQKTCRVTRVDNNETGTVINVAEKESSFPEFKKVLGQVEEIVTHEQRQVEKIVSGWCVVEASISCGKTSISHAFISHGKAISVQHDMRTGTHCTRELRLECETSILNQEHVCSRHSDSGPCKYGLRRGRDMRV